MITVTTRRTDSVRRADPADACLVIIYGTGIGRRVALGGRTLEAGRSSSCDVAIDHESVSRKHARFEWTGTGYRVLDLGSTNGTWVNDRMVKVADLRDRDQVKIGRTILKYISGDDVEASYHEEIYRLMTMDGLTQIANRRAFDEGIVREIARAQRYARPLSLLLFDVDHFKQKNDRWGHLAGDAVLRELAAAVKPHVRREDLLARVGGEEFAVIAPEIDLDGARILGEKLRKVVATTDFKFEAERIPTTISVGAASVLATDRAEDLYGRADAALYQAKQGGRNRVV